MPAFHPAQPGPDMTDELLAQWRDAVSSGTLPVPGRERWAPLRAGVVNMWEFDVAEYWWADGWAQLTGQNQSGKSTLMTLTTLIMLQGEIRAHLIDTFGESGKKFRYYVEPTGGPKDRRDTTSSTNRGWIWVEFGRQHPDGTVEYFTLLLYAQAKRSVQDLTTAWLTCHGPERVRDGLDLIAGQSVHEPKHLTGVDGVIEHKSGKVYAAHIAQQLFGIDDPERYKTVLTMLRSLRTPNLGKVLDADFFTGQIRAALPALDRDEVAELAGSWQQVEQLGEDRDQADNARTAITGYVSRSWRPWADATIRLYADRLLDAEGACAGAGDTVTAANAVLDQARKDLNAESERTTALITARDHAQGQHNELLQSTAYRDATNRAANARSKRAAADTATRHAADAARALSDAQADRDRAQASKGEAERLLGGVRDAVTASVRHTVTLAAAAGFGDAAAGWARGGDVDRLDAAVADRRRRIVALRELLGAASTADSKWQAAESVAVEREAEYTTRRDAATQALEDLTDALQSLSDGVEQWADTLGADAPPVAARERWLQDVTREANSARPRQVLSGLITADWLDPAVAPLTDRLSHARTEAGAARVRAKAADDAADQREKDTDPPAPAPVGWSRRDRPQQTGDGAPLWRFLDPVDGLDTHVLDHVEAALFAAGILDAWVTADGMWQPGRDGDDLVAVLPAAAGGATLTDVLQPAADAGALNDAVVRILTGIGFTSGGEHTAAFSVAADGGFRTPVVHGRAGRAPHGAELIGTAARAARRARDIADLRAAAAAERHTAETFDHTVTATTALIAGLRDAARLAPSDADTAAAGTALTTANTERDKAQQRHVASAAAARQLRTAVDDANREVIRFATEHHLPSQPAQVEKTATAVDEAATAVSGLRLALAERTAGEAAAAAAITAAEQATGRLTDAQENARTLAAEAALAVAAADEADKSIDLSDKEIFEREQKLTTEVGDLNKSITNSNEEGKRLSSAAAAAEKDAQQAEADQAKARNRRVTAAEQWWIPVDAGLTEARNLPTGETRDLTAALEQARTAQALKPAGWPASSGDKEQKVSTLLSKVVGTPVTQLQAVLEASGGRSVSVIEADDVRPLPQVVMTVDASGQQLSPAAAIGHLDDLVAELTASHDTKLNAMYTELLSSTFIDHLSDRLRAVIDLLNQVNTVLGRHPTGADKMTLRLRRHPAAGNTAGFKILKAIEDGVIASDSAQEQIRLFLADRLQQAHDLPATDAEPGEDEWVKRVAMLLDYRTWFDVVCEFRVAKDSGDPTRWLPLTKQEHTVDSGGGKAVTLLQPLLATLVTLYSESATSPRPLWLDEAFVGVDLKNQATMMRMLVDFDLDLLVAGPATLVASAHVPAAAIWHVARAPEPLPGVDLALTLWAGQTLQIVPVADVAAKVMQAPKPAPGGYDGPDLFSTVSPSDNETGSAGEEQQ
jgi:hypothetical protein